jgi:hypothetical protein
MVVMHIETTTAGLLIALGTGRPKARILKREPPARRHKPSEQIEAFAARLVLDHRAS